MQETEHQRNVRKTREASEATAAHAERASRWQAESARHAERAAEAAVVAHHRTLALQEQALGEQRRAAYAMWRQTPDGMAYEAWTLRARELVDVFDERTAEFTAIWGRERDAALSAITPDEHRQHRTGTYVAGKPAAPGHGDDLSYLGSVVALGAAVILFAILGISAWANDGQSIIDIAWPLTALGVSAAFFVFGLVLARRHPEWAEDRERYTAAVEAWTGENERAREAAAESRRARFGFDPLIAPDWEPKPWTAATDPSAWINEYIRDASIVFPAARDLPTLPVLSPRDARFETVPALRSFLQQLA